MARSSRGTRRGTRGALPEKYRVPLVLCYLQELSYEEAAHRAGCSVGALRGRLERGKEQLRKRLAKYGLPLAAPSPRSRMPAEPVSAAIERTTLETVRASATGGRIPPALAGLVGPRSSVRSVLLAPVAVALVAVGVGVGRGRVPQGRPAEGRSAQARDSAADAPAPQPPTDRLGDPLPAGAVAPTRHPAPVRSARTAVGRVLARRDEARGAELLRRHRLRGRDRPAAARAQRLLDRRAARSAGARTERASRSFGCPTSRSSSPRSPTRPRSCRTRPGRMRRPVVAGPDGLEFLALSPDATHLAVVRDPDAKRFTIDLLPATVGKPVAGLTPVKTLGPFDGPCREIRYTPRGVLFLSGSWKEESDWTISIVDHDKNAIPRTITIPPPAYCVWGFMYSLSADARLAAIPLRPKPAKKGESTTNEHTGTIELWNLETGKQLHSLPFAEGRVRDRPRLHTGRKEAHHVRRKALLPDLGRGHGEGSRPRAAAVRGAHSQRSAVDRGQPGREAIRHRSARRPVRRLGNSPRPPNR